MIRISSEEKPTYWFAYLYLLLAQITVTICVIGAKFLLNKFSLITILIIRYSIGVFFLFIVSLLLPKKHFLKIKSLPLKQWGYLILQALCAGAFFNLLLLLGLKHINANEAGIITSALPAVVILFSIFVFKDQITHKMIACICLTMVGIIIINTPVNLSGGSQQFLGRLIVFISLIPEALYYILTKKHSVDMHPIINAFFMNIINIPIFIILSFFQAEKILLSTVLFYLFPFFILGSATALFYIFWLLGSKKMNPSVAGLTTAFMPISTLTTSYFFLAEKITVRQILGMFFVISGIIINFYQKKDFSTKRLCQ